jgi:hypothetical protein
VATLNSAQLQQFAQEGYLVVDNVVDPERDFKPTIEEYAELLDSLARQLYAEGKITSLLSTRPAAAHNRHPRSSKTA